MQAVIRQLCCACCLRLQGGAAAVKLWSPQMDVVITLSLRELAVGPVMRHASGLQAHTS